MSFLDSLFGGLFGNDDTKEEVSEHPCSNCPSSCLICPDACSVCQPYKEQMIEAIYRVEHKDEIISQYEVVGTDAMQGGTVLCPHCGGHSENPYVCDYCGSRLQEGSGKIQVASAADIPNPVLEAQDIIFARQNAVREFSESLSESGSGGFLSSLFDSLLGSGTTEESISIGKKMTESEIKEMADYFHVSVSEYLTGLDNGKYPTLSNKASYADAEEHYSQSSSDDSGDLFSGLAGLAGAFGLGSAILGGAAHKRPQGSYNSSLFGSMSNMFHTGNAGRPDSYGYPGSAFGSAPQQVRPQQVRPQQIRPQQGVTPLTSVPSNRPQAQSTQKPASQTPKPVQHGTIQQTQKPVHHATVQQAPKPVQQGPKATVKPAPKTGKPKAQAGKTIGNAAAHVSQMSRNPKQAQGNKVAKNLSNAAGKAAGMKKNTGDRH